MEHQLSSASRNIFHLSFKRALISDELGDIQGEAAVKRAGFLQSVFTEGFRANGAQSMIDVDFGISFHLESLLALFTAFNKAI